MCIKYVEDMPVLRAPCGEELEMPHELLWVVSCVQLQGMRPAVAASCPLPNGAHQSVSGPARPQATGIMLAEDLPELGRRGPEGLGRLTSTCNLDT